MKLSGHSFNNAVFDSLLDGLKDNVVLKKSASAQEEPRLTGMEVFSSTTENTLNSVMDDQLKFIASELQFAADNARVAVTAEDLAKFAKIVTSEKLRGKNLERAARKFCSNINRANAAPQGTIRTADDLISELRHGTVIPAGYNTEHGPNDSRTGGYLGMSKNPNSIFDSEALARLAEKPSSREEMRGDEQIKDSQNRAKEFRKAMKDQQWQEKQDQLSDSQMLHNSIASTHTGQESGTNQRLPENAMSMFNDDRDFQNIPEKTAGESLKQAAEDRSNKKAAAKEQWNQVKEAKKADNSGNFFFGNNNPINSQTSTQRDSIDWVFDALLKRDEG